MALQTEALDDLPLPAPGVCRGSPTSTRTRVAEVAVQAGLYVCQGTADGQGKLPTSAAEVGKGLGIALYFPFNDSRYPAGGTAGVTYQVGDTVEAATGQIWVTVEEAVAPMDPVFVRWADGNAGRVQKGAFRKDADTVSAAATATAVTGARYLTTAAANGRALVDLNLPQ